MILEIHNSILTFDFKVTRVFFFFSAALNITGLLEDSIQQQPISPKRCNLHQNGTDGYTAKGRTVPLNRDQ